MKTLRARYRIFSERQDFNSVLAVLPQLEEVAQRVGDQQTLQTIEQQRARLLHERILAGSRYLDSSRFDEALHCFSEAIGIDPQSAEAWWCKGQTYAQMGRFDDEIACCDQTIEIRPEYPEAWSMKAAALIALSPNDEALACSNRAIQLKPELKAAWMNKGAALLGLNQPGEAFRSFQEASRMGQPRAASAMAHCQKLLEEAHLAGANKPVETSKPTGQTVSAKRRGFLRRLFGRRPPGT